MKKKKRSISGKKLFWLTLAVILIVIPLMGLLGSNFSNLVGKAVGDKAVQRVDIVQPGSKFFMEIRDVDGLYLLTLNFSEFGKKIVVEIEEVAKVSWGFDGSSYVAFEATSKDEEKIAWAEFTFKVEEAKLYLLGIGRGDLKLYQDGKELETTFDKKEGKYFYYKATTNKLGEFVLGRMKKAEIIEEVSEPVIEIEPEVVPEETQDKLPLAGKAAEEPFYKNFELKTYGLTKYWLIPLAALIVLIILIFFWKRK